jgi:glutamate-1-semialdehyde 2,1-aminomutase
MVTFFFNAGPVQNYEDAKRSDTAKFAKLFHYLLEKGIYFPPSQYEALFISAVHTPGEIAQTARAIAEFTAAD